MTDREYLELAAKAAGLTIHAKNQASRDACGAGDVGLWISSESTCWNPLTDDGPALRLAVKLGLHARQFPIIDDGFDAPLGMVEVWRVDDDDPMHVEFLRSGDDRLAATRRAIVRAAAEIGKGMK